MFVLGGAASLSRPAFAAPPAAEMAGGQGSQASAAGPARSRLAPAGRQPADLEPYQIQLLSPFSKVKKGEPFPIGIFIRLDPGWHSYWSYAGDFGRAPKIAFQAPEGLSISPRPFPRPERHAYSPMEGKTASSHSFIYKKEILFLFEAQIMDSYPRSQAEISLDMEWFVCSEVCIAKQSRLSLELLAAPDFEPLPKIQSLFQKWEARLPSSPEASGGASAPGGTPPRIKSEFKRADPHLLVSLFFDGPLACEDIFPKGAEHFSAAPPRLLSQSESSCLFEAKSSSRLPGISGLLVYKRAGLRQSALFHSFETKPFGLAWFAFLAFIGGLILNIMPCVLPIIFIKFQNVAELGRLPKSRIIRLNLIYAAGVILSFLALALFILASKKAGEAAGWGFHLQSPLFVSLLALLFVSMGFYLLGWIRLPRLRLPAGAGPLKFKDQKALSHFVTGILSTTAASPCVVPFMAPAMGFAFSRSYTEVLVIFALLGLGLSSPYLILSFFPKWLRYIPAPGKWAETLKALLSIPLFLTAAWLAWLLYLQLSIHLFVLSLMCFPLLALIALSERKIKSLRLKRAASLGLALLIAAALALQAAWRAAGPPALSAAETERKIQLPSKNLSWRVFSENHLRESLAGGHPALAAFGAAWCLSCKLNEKVFHDEEAAAFLREAGIHLYYGDWTSRNPEITSFLDSYGQRGVPFYIFYNQKGEAFPLPALLLKGRFLKILKAAMDSK